MSRALAILVGSALYLWTPQLAVGAGEPLAFDAVRAASRPSDLRLLDRHGRVLHQIRTDRSRRRFAWVALDDVSPALQAAVLASEDRRFFSHRGIDWRALLSATAGWAMGGGSRGASTITMQVAALLEPDLRRGAQPRNIHQKWQQMRAAWALEDHWSKPQILEAYLNLATFRGEVQGIGAASAVLYGKSPHALTRAEAAVLAAGLRGPNATPMQVARRARTVVDAVGGHVEAADLDRAAAQVAGARSGALEREAAPHVAPRLLPIGAVEDRTSTLDLDAQLVATSALRRALLALHGRRVRDGAVLVVDNESGEVLAYVGSSGELSAARHVDGVRARRQPGSALKPFLYSLAIEERLLTAASLLEDTPLQIPVATGLYRPENYDERFRGLISVRTALGSSLNIPAVRTLQLVGEQRFAKHLFDLGFEGLTRPGSYYGPALALGSAEVSLWEIVNAYRTLANRGEMSALQLGAGATRPRPRRAYSEATAFITASILADRESRSVSFGLESPLSTRFWSAVKTGTSKDMRDNWCVGFSRRYTVGVWVGNFSGGPMGNVSGVSGAAPVWLEVMQWLHRDEPSDEPAAPPGLVRREVAFGSSVEPPRLEWFLAGTAPLDGDRSLARQAARIVAPTDSTIVAIDREIPDGRQRILLEAESSDPSIAWVLDGAKLGMSTDRILWPPVPGCHQLGLVDEAGRMVDRLAFCVRGNT